MSQSLPNGEDSVDNGNNVDESVNTFNAEEEQSVIDTDTTENVESSEVLNQSNVTDDSDDDDDDGGNYTSDFESLSDDDNIRDDDIRDDDIRDDDIRDDDIRDDDDLEAAGAGDDDSGNTLIEIIFKYTDMKKCFWENFNEYLKEVGHYDTFCGHDGEDRDERLERQKEFYKNGMSSKWKAKYQYIQLVYWRLKHFKTIAKYRHFSIDEYVKIISPTYTILGAKAHYNALYLSTEYEDLNEVQKQWCQKYVDDTKAKNSYNRIRKFPFSKKPKWIYKPRKTTLESVFTPNSKKGELYKGVSRKAYRIIRDFKNDKKVSGKQSDWLKIYLTSYKEQLKLGRAKNNRTYNSGYTYVKLEADNLPELGEGLNINDRPPLATTDEPSIATTDEPSIATTDEPSIATTDEPPLATTDEPPLATTDEPPLATTDEPSIATTDKPSVFRNIISYFAGK